MCLAIPGQIAKVVDDATRWCCPAVFQNRLLLERTEERLIESGLRVLVPERLPPNDGGVSYGQAAVAAAREVG